MYNSNDEAFAFALRWRTVKVIARCSGPGFYDTTMALCEKRHYVVLVMLGRSVFFRTDVQTRVVELKDTARINYPPLLTCIDPHH